jgi:hypothetical protein
MHCTHVESQNQTKPALPAAPRFATCEVKLAQAICIAEALKSCRICGNPKFEQK